MLCPFELKCSPVAFSNFLLLMYPLCSPQRVVSFLPAAMPKYWKLQLYQPKAIGEGIRAVGAVVQF